jgi:hypothetical protein
VGLVVNYIGMLNAPAGTIFCEGDDGPAPLYIKHNNSVDGNDIVIEAVFEAGGDFDRHCWGFPDMTEEALHYLRFYTLTEDEINKVVGKLMIMPVASR